MAEGLARALAPEGVTVHSAGSEPTTIRPEAIEALAQRGIDGSAQYAKGLDEVPMDRIDTVITLCAEEYCPYFPGHVTRFSWAMPDPASVEGEGRLAAFCEARDAIEVKLKAFFSQT